MFPVDVFVGRVSTDRIVEALACVKWVFRFKNSPVFHRICQEVVTLGQVLKKKHLMSE